MVVYIIKCTYCYDIYSSCPQCQNNRFFLHKSNIKSLENRKLYGSKHLYKCSREDFKMMPIYRTDDYSLLQIERYKLTQNRA